MKIKVSVTDFLIFLIFNLILFQVPLMYSVNNYFSYIDEGVAILAGIIFIFSLRKKIDNFTMQYILVLIAYVLLGVLANFTAKIVMDISYIFQGIILFLRNFIIFIGIYRMPIKIKKKIMDLYPVFIFEIKVMLWIAILLWPINTLFDIGMTYDWRFGIRSYEFIFHHPGNFAIYLLFTLLLLTYCEDERIRRKNKIYIIFNIFLIITTLRYSYIIALGIYFIYRIVRTKKINSRAKILFLLIIPIVAFITAYPQFSKYFLQGMTPRLLFYKYAGITVLDYPFGTGFATYGSYMAQVHYSPLYIKYGFSQYYGMGPRESKFLFDNFWPMILVESGILGTFFVLMWFVLVFKKARKEKNIVSQIIIFIFVFFSIVGQTVIHFSSVPFFIMMGLFLSKEISFGKVKE